MLIITSTYITDMTQVEPHRKAHEEWVMKYIDKGTFLFAGPKKDKSEGVIVAKSIDEELLSVILSEDSHLQAGVVEVQIGALDSLLTQQEFKRLRRD